MKTTGYVLPPIRQDSFSTDGWFPTRAQCFIYRNWECVSAERMAKVLACEPREILTLAEQMGLDPNVTVPTEWSTQGYITLIRNNWRLLDYSQLCTLLDWSEEHLAFILKEDDFLSIKLGGYKPDTGRLRLEPLNEAARKRTEEIAKTTRAILRSLPRERVAPFDFFAKTAFCQAPAQTEKGRIKLRFLYSYCALYGDTFLDRQLIDVSFPEEMLRAYQSLGITGIWTQAVLSKLTPYPWDESVSRGYEQRLEGVRYLIARLARYGIKLYLYLNEPRTLPDAMFDVIGLSRGHRHPNGETCLCIRTEEVQNYLRGSVSELVRKAPGLGGFFTITASENRTHCLSDTDSLPRCTCERCREHTLAENFALVNRLIREGVDAADPSVEVIAFSWAWGDREVCAQTVEQLPPRVSVMSVSEDKQEKRVGGVLTRVRDYSISVEGPSPFSEALWQRAAETGHEGVAKIQVNNSWELSAVPYIPVFEQYYRHVTRLLKLGSVNGLMLTWTLGGYPSPVLDMVRMLCSGDGEIPTLRAVYEEIFAGADIDVISQALHCFSEAYAEYPFSIASAYYGPQHTAPANPLYPTPTGMTATMVGYPYDDINRWSRDFPHEIYAEQLRLLSTRWSEGVRLLEKLDLRTNRYLPELYETARMCDLHFRAVVDQCDWVLGVRDGGDREALVRRERALAEEALELVLQNATFGYESSNHYFYTKSTLMEKIVNCDWLLRP